MIDGCLGCSDDKSGCILCQADSYLTPNGTCSTSVCHEHDVTGACVTCNSKHNVQFIPQGETCVTSCSAPYKREGDKCVRPEETCDLMNCAQCHEGACVACEPGKTCVLSCPAGSIHDYESGKCVTACQSHGF